MAQLQRKQLKMNFKNLFLFASLSAAVSMATAGTLTMKAPPEGLRLLTTSGELNYGDEDLVLVGASSTYFGVTPVVGKDVVGLVTADHNEGIEWLYGNEVHCLLKGDYALEVEIVGFKKDICSNEHKDVYQLRTSGADDVVLSFVKRPKTE